MFKIDATANRINPLEIKRFTDLSFTERKHLQEWLKNYPQELLIILHMKPPTPAIRPATPVIRLRYSHDIEPIQLTAAILNGL